MLSTTGRSEEASLNGLKSDIYDGQFKSAQGGQWQQQLFRSSSSVCPYYTFFILLYDLIIDVNVSI